MLTGKAVNEESLREIEALFDSGADEPWSAVLIPFIVCIVISIFCLIADDGLDFPEITLSIIQVCNAFGLAYSAVAVGLLIAGFSIIAGGLSDRITLALTRVKEPVPDSNLLSFIYAIFVHALLTYWRLFIVCFVGLLFTSGDRVAIYFKGDPELIELGPLPNLVSALVLLITVFFVTKSVVYLRSFIKNLHAVLATVAETQLLIALKQDS